MRLHRLRLENFRQHADTEIAFGDGITAIIGPNGAGKTTLLEAIAWAFYGTPAARGSRDSIRWNRAAARSAVRVEVEFALGGHEYAVRRSLYGAELYQDRASTPIANSQQEVTAAVRRVLRMSRDEFFNTYFTGQKELAVMAAMGPSERGRFLSRILGYEKLRTAQDLLRESRSRLRGELAGLERGLADPDVLARERETTEARCAAARAAVGEAERAVADARARRDREGPEWAAVMKMRDAMLALNSDRRVAEKDVVEARREFDRLDRELAEALAAQDQLKQLEPALAEIEPLRTELATLDREARAADQRRLLAGHLAEVRHEVARRTERRASFGEPAGGRRAAEQAAEEARQALAAREREEEETRTAYVRARQDAETKMLALRDQYRDLQGHLETVREAGADGACPTCARPLGDEFPGVIAALTRQLEDVEINGKFFRQRVDQLADEPPDVREARQRLHDARTRVEQAGQRVAEARTREREAQELATELAAAKARAADIEVAMQELPETYDADRHDVVRDRLRALEPVATRATEFRVKARRAEELVQDAERAETALSEREARVAALRTEIEVLGYNEERYERARRAYEDAESGLRDAELGFAAREGDLRTAEEALAGVVRRQADRAERAERIQHVRLDLSVHDELDAAFGDLRTELNAQLRPDLADIASSFLADLTEGRYQELELDEQYQVLVLEDGLAKPVISGGEEDIANLVLRLAISQLVAARAGQPLSLLVLDEIFGSLDEPRRQHVVALLRRLGDRFPQVVLITHIESVRDTVDRVLRVGLDASRGAAVVTEDTGGADEDVAA